MITSTGSSFSCLSMTRPEDVQNPTIILHDHSTILAQDVYNGYHTENVLNYFADKLGFYLREELCKT
jgi:hypothetical protein